MKHTLTTGQMIDTLKEGQIAINNVWGTCVIRKSYGFIWCNKDGSHEERKYFIISDLTINVKWRII